MHGSYQGVTGGCPEGKVDVMCWWSFGCETIVIFPGSLLSPVNFIFVFLQ